MRHDPNVPHERASLSLASILAVVTWLSDDDRFVAEQVGQRRKVHVVSKSGSSDFPLECRAFAGNISNGWCLC